MPCSTEERRAYDAAYHIANRERIVERKRKHYAANRERLLAKSKESNAARHEEKIYYDREYLATHKEQVRETKRAYRKANPLERAAYEAVRRAKKAGASIRDRAGIKEIYRKAREQDVLRCYLCGELVPMGERHVDHVVPLSKGGEHRPSNLAVACAGCNLKKHDKHPAEIGLLL